MGVNFIKKLIFILTTILFISSNVILFKYFSSEKEKQILYYDKLSFSINFKDDVDYNTIFNSIDEITKKSNINVYQYSFLSENDLNIYTSNIKNIKYVHSIENKYPKKNTNQYITNNKSLIKSKDAIGTFNFPQSDLNIKYYNFGQVKNVGLGNIFYVDLNGSNEEKILDYFKNLGDIKKTNSIHSTENPFDIKLIVTILSMLILLSISVVYYLIQSRKYIALHKVLGYTLFSSTWLSLKNIINPVFYGGILGNLFGCIYFIFNSRFYCIVEFIKFNTLLFIFILTIFSLLIVLFSIKSFNKQNLVNTLNGKNFKSFINIVLILSKVAITYVFLSMTVTFIQNYETLNYKIDNLSHWNKTKNIYKTVVANQGEFENTALEYTVNNRLEQLYKKLVDHNNAFIIDADNYIRLNNGLYVYEENMKLGNSEYGEGGKSIRVDMNYFKVNPIKTANEIPLDKSIIHSSDTLNILVPEKLKYKHSELYNEYLDYFYFIKVEVDNIYNEELNKSINKTKKSSLKINIIYVKDNQKYFTFSEYHGDPKDSNYITDPVAFIYTGNIDNSFVRAWATRCLYLFDYSNGDAYENLSNDLISTNTRTNIFSVDSVYKSVHNGINELRAKNNEILFLLTISFFINLILSVSYIFIYYKNNSYKLYLQTLFGEKIMKTYSKTMFPITLLYISTILITYIKSSVRGVILIGIFFLTIELFATGVFNYLISKKNVNKILKGER